MIEFKSEPLGSKMYKLPPHREPVIAREIDWKAEQISKNVLVYIFFVKITVKGSAYFIFPRSECVLHRDSWETSEGLGEMCEFLL